MHRVQYSKGADVVRRGLTGRAWQVDICSLPPILHFIRPCKVDFRVDTLARN